MIAADLDRLCRRSIRLKGYDYAQSGSYFLTVCTLDRACLFGEIVDGEMFLNQLGRMVERTWDDLPNHMANVELDAFMVMPDHIHGVVVIEFAGAATLAGAGSAGTSGVGAGSEPAPTRITAMTPAAAAMQSSTRRIHRRPEIVRQLKTFSARRINQARGTPGISVGQRSYYEHVIRNEESLNHIRRYGAENAQRWAFDRENPDANTPEPEGAWLIRTSPRSDHR
ncbi:MAG TPA: transposase [Clostridiales bacterium]|nr:transposase [Clostridiales bacterium]